MSAVSESSITPKNLHQLRESGSSVELLDVRTPPEFANAHVAGAKLVPLNQLDPKAFLAQRGKDSQPLYVLCQAGGRAAKAIEGFRQVGFENAILVEGGTQAWIDAGLPIERGETKVLPLMRQVQIVIGLFSGLGAILALTVNPLWALLPLFTGAGLVFAGVTGICGLALLMAKAPWNK